MLCSFLYWQVGLCTLVLITLFEWHPGGEICNGLYMLIVLYHEVH